MFLGFDEFEHTGVPKQLLFGVEHVGDAIRTQRIARDQGLRDGAIGLFFGKAAQVARHGVYAGGIELHLQRVRFRQARERVVDDFLQAFAVGQREIEVFDQRFQFRWDGDFGRGDDYGAPVGGELLAHIAQAAHYDRIVHVTVKIFQDEDGFDGHRLHIGQSLRGLTRVVDGRTGSRRTAVRSLV